ncbi:unnamed protein product [Hyaloperonospora brassicae]|uniref:Ras-GAP domain-containing protein n=1 Tax=Hyaloperonospora brassicae TaxID=162125 RepID=A0AAV0TU61_HYABA|nr:unnamed protein product [Hyaloperonospora brassicae]
MTTGTAVDADARVSRAVQSRAADAPAMTRQDVVAGLSVLTAALAEHVTGEERGTRKDIDKAVTRVLDWLHLEIATPALHTVPMSQEDENDGTLTRMSVQKQLSQVLWRWHEEQPKSMHRARWMLWLELGCTLEVLRCCEVVEMRDESCALLMTTPHPPRDFPTSATLCDKEQQVVFCRELWDAVLVRPLNEAPFEAQCVAAPILVDVFAHWWTAAIQRYELVFVANVAIPLREHIHDTLTSNLLLKDAWLSCARRKGSAAGTTTDAGCLAVAVMVLSALTVAHQAPEIVQYLSSLGADTVVELSRQPFPHPRRPVAVVAMALGLTILDDARRSSDVCGQSQSGDAVILSQFALLRLVNLPLMAPPLKPYSDATISEYQTKVHEWVKALVFEPSYAVLHKCLLQMAELCIEEVVSFFQTSRKTHLDLVAAMRSVLPTSSFRTNVLQEHLTSRAPAVHDKCLLMPIEEIVRFTRQFYAGVAPILEVLAVDYTVQSFVALSRIEFAREMCAFSCANASMQVVTKQLEQALEKTASPPEQIFAPVLRSIAMHAATTNANILPETDVVSACQALAVGRVVQRGLRILLFQCASLIDDVLSVVFSVLYNVFEPADTFGHGFIGMCLSHLAQFIPRAMVLPHYLQVTLASYPANASSQALTKACGVVFGSLFYSDTLAVPATSDANRAAESTRHMVVWAIRKCCERSTELLAEEEAMAVTEDSAKKAVASSETGGMYLAGLVFDLMKIAPVDRLVDISMEAERLLAHWKTSPRVLRKLKSALFARVSVNCEAKTRAWVAAWYIEVDRLYPVETALATRMTLSRL